MWVDRVLGNVADDASGANGHALEFLDIQWFDCGRMLKKRTRGGKEVRVLLAPGCQLRHGDVLFADASRQVVVNVAPCEVIVARPSGAREAAVLALELGNLHWPTQVCNAEIIFVEDGPPMAVLEDLKVSWSRDVRRFEPTPIGAGPGVKLAENFQILRRRSSEGARVV